MKSQHHKTDTRGEGELFDAQRKAIERLKACERGLAEIYARYAEVFHACHDFWRGLSDEEKLHEQMLDNALRWLAQGHLIKNLGQVADKNAVDALWSEIQKEQKRLAEHTPDEMNAFSRALAFETNVADNHFFDLVHCAHSEFKAVAQVLRKASQRHRDAIALRMIERKRQLIGAK